MYRSFVADRFFKVLLDPQSLTPSFLRLDPQVFVTTFPASSRPWRVAGVTPHADFDIQQPFFSFWKTCHQVYLSRR
jgi:hypothetical protein